MIKNKITPEIKLKFLDAIDRTKETGNEHGFYLCSNEKLTASKPISSEIKPGIKHSVDLGDPIIACKGKKIEGSFHTHSYFTLFKKTSKFMEPKMRKKLKLTSDENIKSLINNEFERYKKESNIKELTIDSPSTKDLLKSILNKCVLERSEGATCVSSDLGNDIAECWTPKEITQKDCEKAYNMLYENYIQTAEAVIQTAEAVKEKNIVDKEKDIVKYEKWMIPLFEIEKINLK